LGSWELEGCGPSESVTWETDSSVAHDWNNSEVLLSSVISAWSIGDVEVDWRALVGEDQTGGLLGNGGGSRLSVQLLVGH